MTLGSVTLPLGTVLAPSIKTLETRNRTQGGTLKRDIRAQKQFYSLNLPIVSGTDFEDIKVLKEALANVDFVYPDEDGVGNITVTVAINNLKYQQKKVYPDGSMWIDGITLGLEEV